MAASTNFQNFQNIILSPRYKYIFALIKGIRNGIVYGCKVRFPHALVMTFLFKQGSLEEKMRYILTATYTHGRNLALMVTGYKSLSILLSLLGQGHTKYHSFLFGGIVGYIVFGEYNKVNEQVNLYLLSRITQGLMRYASSQGYLPYQPSKPFRWFAATVWAVVMWLFTYHRSTLQPSLQSSMTYLYEDSNVWHSARTLLWHNK